MKTKKLIAATQVIAAIIACNTVAHAQSWNINGNANIAAGTNYLGTSDPNDLVFRTNALERGRLLGVGGTWRFGSAANNMQVDSLGKLSFNGNGVYQVAGNKYAFQYKNDPDFGLYFNSSDVRYEFRNGTAQPVFYIDAGTGALSVGNFATGVNYLLPSARGLNNQVLKTDGAGNVSWSTDANTTYTAGAGLSLAGTTFTNAAPDQVVSLTGTNGISASGTYPNFTLSGSGLWRIRGNDATNPATDFIGTTDLQGLAFRTNNLERMRIASGGNVGIGTVNPNATLHVATGTEATLAGGGYMIVGTSPGGTNLQFDDNEIQARSAGLANTLNLNPGGGSVFIGGNLDVNGSVGFGSVETFSDGGSFTINSNSDINPSTDNARGLGDASLRWTDVWAVDGTINTSDERDKKNIRDLDYGLKEIMKLRAVKFNWKNAVANDDKVGLIAQELKKVLPEVVRDYEYRTDEATGKKEKVPTERMGVMYSDIIPVLIRAIQEQQQQIDALKKLNGTGAVAATPTAEQVSAVNVKLSNAALEQNVPNPLRSTTSIRYNIPADAVNASLLITDMGGKNIRQISLKTGAGVVNIDATALNAGTYNYTLIVDGRNIETKRMIVAK
ncbi:tail fiber domain-containing protein [Panacibacter sp. DH6]|uniref:Tail fiber domain-containing protein n=1 Tax=Panacibacter microcysteis TaxID=2793269 RepID=A0A931EB05_9BACT|nr:tail fiber domain-containing protein [Panacibacter microcysteis]MBG9377664.1 tail fiber domain-containing protein [Panacibacter microcysteis]